MHQRTDRSSNWQSEANVSVRYVDVDVRKNYVTGLRPRFPAVVRAEQVERNIFAGRPWVFYGCQRFCPMRFAACKRFIPERSW
ncbi:hypothetical protein ZHAS_00004271 [Anopheles sinensis]|uniref:Uncharacterized protein n=1 Tax=Anopheles sinensis TaxID=74873 RepID=A0A084VGI5_ANOSI|nr:hypothetical protein ZHAS_00004271 [Anopheles sinensis]